MAISDLVDYVDNVYLKFGGSDRIFGVGDGVEPLRRRATLARLRLVPVKIRHLGTDRCTEILAEMYKLLSNRVDIETKMPATHLIVEDGQLRGVIAGSNYPVECDYLVVAPGREGADWLTSEARRLQLTLRNNPVDLGVRVELPAETLEEFTDVLYEPKLEFYSKSFDDKVRTFCVCPYGEVTTEYTSGPDAVVTVNGHSYSGKKTQNTNFALLVSTNFTEPFYEPIAYGRYLARLANIISGGVIIQRLGDLLSGRRSTPERIKRGIVTPTLKAATPGDLSFALPYRHLKDILEMLEALDKLAPGVNSPETLLYGLEVKFYSSRLQLSSNLETQVPNLFAAGDGAGVTRGLVQASVSGVIAAREILRRAGVVSEHEESVIG